VAGFDLPLAPQVARRLAEHSSPVLAAAHHLALLASAGAMAQPQRAALVRIDAGLLQRESLLAAVPAHTWLCVSDLPALPAAAAAALRSRAVRLGLPDGPPCAQPAVDFVLTQAAPAGVETLLLSGQRWRDAQPQVAMVAVDLPHLEDIEGVLKSGFMLAGGLLGRSAQPVPPRALGTAAHRICELINLLALNRELSELSEAVRADAALTYRLLRYANSPGIGLQQPVQTVEQAVMVLGRSELGRWLSVMLLSSAQARQASPALQDRALARARLLENLVRLQGQGDTGTGFTLGLLSGIEPLLQVPLATALEPLRLPADSRAALLERKGPWAPGLDLLDALDAGDEPGALQGLQGMGLADDGLEAVAELQDEAWAWASEVSRTG
jgi:EAL and modified HD-GYP domain-containing signal transduction protein